MGHGAFLLVSVNETAKAEDSLKEGSNYPMRATASALILSSATRNAGDNSVGHRIRSSLFSLVPLSSEISHCSCIHLHAPFLVTYFYRQLTLSLLIIYRQKEAQGRRRVCRGSFHWHQFDCSFVSYAQTRHESVAFAVEKLPRTPRSYRSLHAVTDWQ
jgi:hypothetical protein